MKGIVDVCGEFDSFCAVASKDAKAELLGCLANGFEGWLKIEFMLWLAREHDLTIGMDVGAEYTARLDQRFRNMDRKSKKIDLWVRAATRAKRFHYIELKAPFDNKNSSKMLASAANDRWYLMRTRPSELAASSTTIVVGCRFTDERWAKAQATVDKLVGKVSAPAARRTGRLGDLSWASWTQWHIAPPKGATFGVV